MRPRKYKDRITVMAYQNADDGFGGAVADAGTKVADSWCGVRTLGIERITDYGLDQNRTYIEVRLRKREDVDYTRNDLYLIYKGKEYAINRVEETNFDGYHYIIIATGKQ